jgi:hypothetical protein
LHDFVRVSNDWKSVGESTVVTAIFPRKSQEEELTSIKSLDAPGAKGFDAVTPKGTHVMYQAASVAPASLQLGGLGASAESLLLTIETDGTKRGIALGCKTMFIAGKVVAIPSADFEFELMGSKLKTTQIYVPLQPVKISPDDTTAFIGSKTVTMTCASPKSEIRYTLDGSDPTPNSRLYAAPVVLTTSTTVKARSMRPGTTVMPTVMSGTDVSIATEALYDLATPAKAVDAPATVPGLHYEYYEGRWQELLSAIDRFKPIKTGDAAKLFDTSAKGTSPTYAFKYTGYLEVPTDGVYNFYAPPEYYEPSIMAGYELRLTLDGKDWYPTTARHALGAWSIGLAKGKHQLEVYYADLRADGPQKMNKPGLKPIVWEGTAPNVELAGPGLPRGPIAASMLSHVQ